MNEKAEIITINKIGFYEGIKVNEFYIKSDKRDNKRDKFLILILLGGGLFNVHIYRQCPYCDKENIGILLLLMC